MRCTFRVGVFGAAIFLSPVATGFARPLGWTRENTPGSGAHLELYDGSLIGNCGFQDLRCRNDYDRLRRSEYEIAGENAEQLGVWTLLESGMEWQWWNWESEFPSDFLAEHDPSSYWWAAHHCRNSPEGCLRGGPSVSVDIPGTDGGGRTHEYLSSESTPTPEPLSVILMGTFLSLAGGVASRNKRGT